MSLPKDIWINISQFSIVLFPFHASSVFAYAEVTVDERVIR